MKSILRVQFKVLAFACNPKTTLPLNDIRAFQKKFGAFGDWLFGKLSTRRTNGSIGPSRLHVALSNLINYTHAHPAQRREILQAFLNDSTFHRHLADASFQFGYRVLLEDTKKVVAPLMQLFYDDILENGFPVNSPGGSIKFNREAFVKAYWTANDRKRLCAACDGPKPTSESGKVFSDTDHFFPKSLYPFLCVHASNLLPICKYCNQSLKGSKDPIDDHVTAPLLRSFYPYDIPAIEHIEVHVTRTTATTEKKVSLRETVGGETPRVKNLNKLLRLEKVWLDSLRDTMDLIIEDLRSLPELDARIKEPLRDSFPELLRSLLKTKESRIGRWSGSVISASYLRYAINDPLEIDRLLNEVNSP